MRTLVGTLLAAATFAFAPTAGAYPWPLKPFDRPHPVRANFGDPRTVFFNQPPESLVGPGIFGFHNGIDISADGGTRVYPVADGWVHYVSPTAISVRAMGVDFRYVHIRPIVVEGQLAQRSRTVLGYVEPWAGHLHFTEIRHGRAVNPLRRGAVHPYFDGTHPVVTEIVVRDPAGRVLERPYALCGAVAISAAAQDPTSMPIPGARAGLPVSPAIVSWSLRATVGELVVEPRIAVDFLRGLPLNSRFWSVYARGTFQNTARFGRTQLSRLQGYFLFVLAPRFNTTLLTNGTYVLTVTAEDARGNQGTLSETLTVANGASGCSA